MMPTVGHTSPCHLPFHPQPKHLTAKVTAHLLTTEGWKAELALLADWWWMP